MSLGPLYVLLGEVLFQVLCPFFKIRLFVFLECSQIHVWGIIGKYMFPYSCFPLHFADVFFSHSEVFNWMKSHLFILSFMSLALGDILVKILLCGISEILLPMFSSRTFMVSQLIFKSFLAWVYFCVHGLEELTSSKWLYYPKQFIDSTQSLLKYQWHISQI